MIDRLLRRGIISKDFVASVMMIDLENPVLSADRESLWQFIPEKFSLTPVKNWRKSSGRRRRNKRSKNQGIAAIQAANVSADSAPGKWLQILQQGNSVTQLRNKITDYLKKTQTDLDENAPTRPQELKRLCDNMVARRQSILHHPVLRALNETGDRLFPIPETVIENPHHQRQ